MTSRLASSSPAEPEQPGSQLSPTGQLRPVGSVIREIVPPEARRRPSAKELRVVEAAVAIRESAPSVAYQHTVLCQTCLPYRDPGDAVREWERDNGKVLLNLEAGKAMHPKDGLIKVGLPFGPKPRLILSYLNTQAIIHQKPEIDVEDSLTAFVKRVGLASHGRNIRTIKDQLGRLSATRITLGIVNSETEATTVNTQIISRFDLWFPKDDRQRVMWPTAIVFGREYFDSLLTHAVPLDERALAALSDSAMALDIYAWLGQRLHRQDQRHPAFIPWPAVQQQFGEGFARLRKFREKFLGALRQVQAVYPAAKIQASPRGLTLYHSAPPVPYRAARRLAKAS